ncbi:hypothetical protein L218DRAFT_314945 [Marasmius fiardii PR-910]|nr:hypothetical protein L218DRAFT_314945 [Marasmius fiardii PR-910]
MTTIDFGEVNVARLLQQLADEVILPEEFTNSVFGYLELSAGPGQLSQSQKEEVMEALFRLEEKDIVALGHQESVCPVCFTSLLALLAEEETATAMDSPAHPVEELGVTRLSQPWQCGHIFCRRDIRRWVMDGHDSCPTCRRKLVKTSDESGPGTNATPVDNTAGDAYDSATQLRNILEHLERSIIGDGGGAFISDISSTNRNSSRPTDLSNEYSAMYS